MQKQYLECPNCGTKMKCDRRATGKAAKVHGGGFEHKVAKALSRLTGLRWKKTPASGGMHIAGDVFCIDFIENPYIECKNREDITLGKIFKNPNMLLTADDGDPLVSTSPVKIAVFNNTGQMLAVAPISVVPQGVGNYSYVDLADGYTYLIAELGIIKTYLMSFKGA